MSLPDENEDAMTASFTASNFESDANDPWTAASQGLSPVDLSTILSGMPLPAIYTTAFDLAQPSGGKVTVLAVNKIMGVSGLPPAAVDKIMNIVVAPTRSRITKGECSVALALVAMAQKNMDLSIENLTAHREDLPIPHLPGLESIDFGSTTDTSAMYSTSSSIPKHHPVNVGSSISDPWRSSTYKGNGYPPPPSYLASPPIPSTDAAAAHDPEAARVDMHHWFLNLDTIRITFAPEKEGIFLFKHTNYIVESKRFSANGFRTGSCRTYHLSDLEASGCPFTIEMLVADEVFLERRLRGLIRFMNALMRHPELALWRKNVVISTEDEFTSQLPIPESLPKQIPLDLELQLEKMKRRLSTSVEYFRSMVHVMDRVQKRTEATAADFMRYSLALNALADSERQCHVEDCFNCGQLSQGYGKIGSHICRASNVLEEQAKAMQRGMVEDLKRHRDLLVSVGELLERRDRSREGTMIGILQKRIISNEAKLRGLKASAEAAAAAVVAAARAEGGVSAANLGDPGAYDAQIEKVTNNIHSDRANLHILQQRMVLMQYTLWMEITYYHKNQASIATLYQNFVHEQIKSSQSLRDNWKSLSPIVHELPMDVNGFN
ncbi:Sorting nexin mvp1 [Mortierella alpina]|nr:Sorting nexin mvp1 [Mortierella alpina]